MIKFGVIVFPGSNCDHDAYHAARHVFEQDARFIWHKETKLGDLDVVIVPGGFSYGDYLRAGAVARFSPIMQDVIRFANDGGLVLGICNGFQVLCESHLLPGALLRNASLRFACKQAHLRVENAATPFTNALEEGQVIEVPVAHGEGNYYASDAVLDRLRSADLSRVRMVICDLSASPFMDLAGSRNRQLVLVTQLIHTKDRNDILKFFVALEDQFHILCAIVVRVAKHRRSKNP